MVAIVRLCGATKLGEFGVAAAVVAPLMLLARMQLRTVVATEDRFFGDRPAYLLARLMTSAAVLGISATIGFLVFPPSIAWAVLFLAVERCAADQSELAWGFLQREGRWRRIALSQAVHGIGGALAVTLSLAAGLGLPAALGISALAHAVLFLALDGRASGLTSLARSLFDRPNVAAARVIFRRCGLLAPAAALVSLNGHLPRFALERWVGVESVGSFAALVQLTLLGNLTVQAFGQASLTPMANADREGFTVRIERLTRLSLGVAASGTVASLVLGGWILTLLYGPSFAALAPQLAALAAVSVFLYLAGVWGYALAALGERRLQVAIYSAAVAAGAAAAVVGTPVAGLWGGIAAYGVGWAVAAAGCAWGVRRALHARAVITREPRATLEAKA